MIFRYGWWPTVLILQLLVSRSRAQLFFRAPAFDCSRVHPRYCCTTRVRLSCPQLCGQAPCSRTPTFVQPFSPHIPPTLPFPGLAPQPHQTQVPQQSRLPTLIDPTALTANTKSQQPPPDPPPGIVLPSVEVPLAVGTPLPDQNAGQTTDNLSNVKPVDGFASAVRNRQGPATTVGAGGSFAPVPNTNNLVGIAPVDPTNPAPNAFVPSSQFPAPQPTTAPAPPLNTFPTLINFVPTSTAMPPSVAPPWAFSPTPQTPNSQFTTVVTTIVTKGVASQGPNTVVDSHSHGNQRKKVVLPPPNKFMTATGEELVELESIDRRAIHVDSHAAVEKVVRSKDTPSSGIEILEPGIAKTIIVGSNTFPPPITANFSEQIAESHEKFEPTARTTIPDKTPGSWSFKIMPSRLSKDPVAARGHVETIPHFNTSTSQWIGSQTSGVTAGVTPPQSNGIFQGDKFNLVIDSVFNKRTIDTITSLTGRRPPKPKGRVGSVTAPPPVASNLETTTIRFTTQGVGVVSQNGSIPQNCGVAPHFTPCLDLNRANLRLLSCCRAKLLPEGCWPLCRYDTTQAEVKKTFEAGKCGILNVAPFLECASQGMDNLQCCQHRQISVKSGPQCEVFCHPSKGLGSLGIQHLACQNVISDLLQCHHSGLRP